MELIVGLLIMSTFMAGVTGIYLNSSWYTYNNEIIIRTEESARSVLDIIIYDLRMLGTGMPIGQSNFSIDDEDIGTAALPLLTSSDSNDLTFRLNETGAQAITTAEFDPSAGQTIQLTDTSDFSAGDFVYVSDSTAGGSDGLRGEISSVTNSQITLNGVYQTADGSVFPLGSTVSRVVTVDFESMSDWDGITRDNGTGEVLLAENVEFEVVYYDSNGDEIETPLSESEILNELTTIEVTVTARSSSDLRDGSRYYAEARQTVALRNLILVR